MFRVEKFRFRDFSKSVFPRDPRDLSGYINGFWGEPLKNLYYMEVMLRSSQMFAKFVEKPRDVRLRGQEFGSGFKDHVV